MIDIVLRAAVVMAVGFIAITGCNTREEHNAPPADTVANTHRMLKTGISFDQATPSVLDPDARIFVDSPATEGVVQLHSSGNGAYIWFDADLQGFALAAVTRGTSPCGGGSAGQAALAIDTGKGNGQHIYVVVDEENGRVITHLPAQIPIAHFADAGPHTLRVFLSRSWEEGLRIPDASRTRETDLYAVRTFSIGSNNGSSEVDTTLPLLTLNAPLDSTLTTYPSNQILLDFHLTFRSFDDGYRLEAMLMDSVGQSLHCDTLHALGPYCISGLSDPPAGRLERYRLRLRMLDAQGNPVANGVRYNMNLVERQFCVRPQ